MHKNTSVQLAIQPKQSFAKQNEVVQYDISVTLAGNGSL